MDRYPPICPEQQVEQSWDPQYTLGNRGIRIGVVGIPQFTPGSRGIRIGVGGLLGFPKLLR